MKYWIERLYPYIIAAFCAYLSQRIKVDIMLNENFNELLGNLVTLDSIVIGFFGAVMPVIVSMKNESKFVRYVFENDTKRLFAKYLKSTIFSGLASALFSLVLFIRNSFTHIIVKNILYIFWIFFTSLFLVSTYRSLSYMISLIFSKDEIGSTEKHNRQKDEQEKELEKMFME